MKYMARIIDATYTEFNNDTEDWSGKTYSVEIKDTLIENSMEQLYVEVARYFGTSEESFRQDYIDGFYTTVESNRLVDYGVQLYKIEEI